MIIICRIQRHCPIEMEDTRTGETVVRCTRCGRLEDEWDDPLMSRATKAALFSCAGVGLGTYAGADAFVTSPGKAIATALIAFGIAVCARFGENAVVGRAKDGVHPHVRWGTNARADRG